MIFIWALIICGVLAIGVVAILAWMDLLPGFERQGRSSSGSEIPPGCLVGVVAACAVWFVAWAVVLILALNFLRTPLN